MPDWIVDSLDAIPEGLRSGAKPENGKFVVKVVEQSKLDEFRDNNVNLSRERDTLKGTVASYESLSGGKPFDELKAEVETLRQIKREVDDGKLTKNTDVVAEVERRVSAMRADHDRQLTEKAQEAARYRNQAEEVETRYRRSKIDQALMSAVMDEKSGASPSAMQDFLMRAYNVFVVESGGNIVARDGEATIYGADGTTPMTPAEWVQSLKTKAPHLFKGSTGGGAGGGTKSANIGGLAPEEFAKLKPQERLRLARLEEKQRAGMNR